MRLGKEEQKIVVLMVLGGLALLIAFYNFSLKPNFKNLKTFISEVSKLKTDIKSIKKDIVSMKNLQKQLENTRKQSEFAVKGFLSSSDFTPLLEEVSRLAKSDKVKIVNMSPVKDKTSGDKKQMVHKKTPSKMETVETSVSVNIKGGYHNIGRFISALESSLLLLSIKDLDMAVDYADSSNHNAVLLISAYALAENET